MNTQHIPNEPTIADRALACLAVAFLIASVLLFNSTLPR